MELTENDFLKICRFLFRKSDVYKSIPFTWDMEKDLLKQKNKLSFMYFRFYYACIYVAIASFQVILNWNDSDLFVKTYGMFGLSAFLFALPSYYVVMRHGKRVAALLNSMIQFERKELLRSKGKVNPEWFLNPSKSWKIYTSIIKAGCCMMGLANNFCVVFHSNAMFHPCFSINLFYQLSSECAENGFGFSKNELPTTVREFFIRLWIVTTGLTMWLSLSSACMCVIAMLTIMGHCLACYIQYYQRLA